MGAPLQDRFGVLDGVGGRHPLEVAGLAPRFLLVNSQGGLVVVQRGDLDVPALEVVRDGAKDVHGGVGRVRDERLAEVIRCVRRRAKPTGKQLTENPKLVVVEPQRVA